MNQPLVEKNLFDEIAREFTSKTGLPLVLVDREGTVVYEYNRVDLCGQLGIEENAGPFFREWRKKSVEGSFRWGEAYFSMNPLGLVCFSVPVIQNCILSGACISGYAIFPEMRKDFDRDITRCLGEITSDDIAVDVSLLEVPVVSRKRIRHHADLLFRMMKRKQVSDLTVLSEKKEYTDQQLNIAYYIECIKKEKPDTARLILEKQEKIIDRVFMGDITGAREIMNEFLGYIFFDSGMNFEMLKIRVMELVIILSRSAVEYGVKPAELLGLNYSHLSDLFKITDYEKLCHRLTVILDKYISTISSLKKNRKNFEVKKMTEYIDHHFSDKITSEEIAGEAGLSVSRALHLFKEETGVSFSEYLKKTRVECGKFLLANTDDPIADIAVSSGFTDQSHFTKQFKLLENMTPRQYRLKLRELEVKNE